MIVRDGLGSNAGLISSGITTTGGILAATIPAIAAVPLIGPIIAGVALLVNLFGVGNGCGGTCTEATQVTNQVTPLATQVLNACQQTVQENGCLTSAEQASAIQSINSLWSQLDQACSQIPAPGGTQCISDRKPGGGGKYDWNTLYINPIMAMPICAASSGIGIDLGSVSPLLLIGGGVLLLGLFMGGGD